MKSKIIKDSNGNSISITVELKIEKRIGGKREITFTATQNEKVYISTSDLKHHVYHDCSEDDYIRKLDALFIVAAKEYFSNMKFDNIDILTKLGYM